MSHYVTEFFRLGSKEIWIFPGTQLFEPGETAAFFAKLMRNIELYVDEHKQRSSLVIGASAGGINALCKYLTAASKFVAHYDCAASSA